jgi:hypothetical protein
MSRARLLILAHRARCVRLVDQHRKPNLAVPEVVFSLAVAGTGKSLYQAALAAGHEGVMAKQLASVYRSPFSLLIPAAATTVAAAAAPKAGSPGQRIVAIDATPRQRRNSDHAGDRGASCGVFTGVGVSGASVVACVAMLPVD